MHVSKSQDEIHILGEMRKGKWVNRITYYAKDGQVFNKTSHNRVKVEKSEEAWFGTGNPHNSMIDAAN